MSGCVFLPWTTQEDEGLGVGWIIHLILLKCWLSTFVFRMFYYYFFNQSLQSFTLRSDSKSPGCSQKSCSRSAAPTPPKRRNSVLWSETLDTNTKESLSTKEIKRQEVTAHGKLDWGTGIGNSSRGLLSLPLLGKEEQPLGGELHLPVHLNPRFMSASTMGKGGFHSGIHLPSVTLGGRQTFPRHP